MNGVRDDDQENALAVGQLFQRRQVLQVAKEPGLLDQQAGGVVGHGAVMSRHRVHLKLRPLRVRLEHLPVVW